MSHGAFLFLIGKYLADANARMIINGEMNILPTGRRSVLALVALLCTVAGYAVAKLEGDGIDIAEYAMHKIAHAALGCLTGAISANDCASGALGGVAGAVVSEGYRAMTEPEMKAELNRIRGDLANRGWSEEQQSAYLNEQMLEWRARGVDLTKLSAGLFALVAGADVDVAAGTAGNVAENNVLPLLIIITKIGIAAYTAYELVQSAKKAYDLAELALDGKLSRAQLIQAAKQLGIEIVAGVVISKLKLAEAAYTLAVKAGNRVGADKLLGRIFRLGCGRNSFAPLTPILMADGSYRPIRSIGIGDLVASRNEFTGIHGANRVTALPGDWHEDRVVLTLEDKARGLSEVITTTLEHPFHVPGGGFVAAGQLEAGMTVSRWSPSASPLQTVGFRAAEAATGHLLVKAITITRSGLKKWRAYNLTVEGDHTYFVGKTNAWVHNSCFESDVTRRMKAKVDIRDDNSAIIGFRANRTTSLSSSDIDALKAELRGRGVSHVIINSGQIVEKTGRLLRILQRKAATRGTWRGFDVWATGNPANPFVLTGNL